VFDGDLLDRRAHFQPRSAKRTAGATEGSGVHANPLWTGAADEEAVQESGPDANQAGGSDYPNQRWSMECGSDRLVDGRWFRILTVVDQCRRECLCAHADRSQTGEKVSAQLERVRALRGAPEAITSDNGSEFADQAMDYWAHQVASEIRFHSSWQAGGEQLHRELQRPTA
jgi:transposase InsO family protein